MSNNPEKETSEPPSVLEWVYDRLEEKYKNTQKVLSEKKNPLGLITERKRSDVIEFDDYYIPSEIGDIIVEWGLSDFLFSTYKILSKYSDFHFNNHYKGVTGENCLIINTTHDAYKDENYDTKFSYSKRVDWKIAGYGASYYLIDDKHRVGLKGLIFAVNLYKKYINNFNDNKLTIEFSLENPVRIDYEGFDIRIYLFQNF